MAREWRDICGYEGLYQVSDLSHQADELRETADRLRMLASGMDAPYIVPSTKETMALAMQSAASEMRKAADTIEKLQAKLDECGGRAEAFTLLTNGTVCVGSKQLVARIAELQSRLNNVALGGGKLTAEQVRECVERVYLEGYSDGSVNRGAHIDETDWQAIADELNATQGCGECEVIQSDNGPKCSKCGKELPEDPYSDYEGNFCPTCGARIRKAVKR